MKAALLLLAMMSQTGAEVKIPLTISGGHQTDPRDRGRPVVLIAAALGVPAEVFREAFSHVRPAPAGQEPEPAQVERNKAALLGALGPRGVTNDRLDEVSNYYRYRPGGDRLWPAAPASGYAVLRDGKVLSVVVTEGGSGYSSPPSVSIPGHPEIALEATVVYGTELKKNGALASVKAVLQ
jgi:hypothetical protein